MILAEIGDLSRFDSPDKILAYAGATTILQSEIFALVLRFAIILDSASASGSSRPEHRSIASMVTGISPLAIISSAILPAQKNAVMLPSTIVQPLYNS